MSTVFGFSIGAEAIRILRIVDDLPEGGERGGRSKEVDLHFSSRSIPVVGLAHHHAIAEAVADLATVNRSPLVIACPDDRLGRSVQAELRVAELPEVRFVSEAEAVLEFVNTSGAVRGFRNLLIYDLGKTGLTVSIVDIASGRLQSSLRTTRISGDLLDHLVVERVRGSNSDAGIGLERDGLTWTEYGREIKESLSRTLEYRVSESTPIVLTRFEFEDMTRGLVASTVSVINEAALRAECRPDVVVMVGGGARIPLIEVVLRQLSIPVIRPAEPELVAGKGAALWARLREVPTRAIPTVKVPAAESLRAWKSSADDNDSTADIAADLFSGAAAGDVSAPSESESASAATVGRRSRLPFVLGVTMSVAALLSMFAWGVFRPFSDEAVAEVPAAEPSAVTSQPVTTTRPVDPLTVRVRMSFDPTRSWRY